MALQLPRLKTSIDCAPLEYPGLVVEFWLNVTQPEREWEPPDEPEPWDTLWYHGLARMLERVIIPPAFTTDDNEIIIELPDAEAVWHLERMPGFDPVILPWAIREFQTVRAERLEGERKN